MSTLQWGLLISHAIPQSSYSRDQRQRKPGLYRALFNQALRSRVAQYGKCSRGCSCGQDWRAFPRTSRKEQCHNTAKKTIPQPPLTTAATMLHPKVARCCEGSLFQTYWNHSSRGELAIDQTRTRMVPGPNIKAMPSQGCITKSSSRIENPPPLHHLALLSRAVDL